MAEGSNENSRVVYFDKKSTALIEKLREFFDPDTFIQILLSIMKKQSLLAAAEVVKTQFGPGKSISTRTGMLARSIGGDAELENGLPVARVGVFIFQGANPAVKEALAYARVQELGTVGKGGELPTIKPRNAKALAIPVNDSLTAAGVRRFTGPREDPRSLRFIPFRRGVAVGALFEEADVKDRKDGKIDVGKAAYLLLKKVDISPKLFIRSGVIKFLPKFGKNVLDELTKRIPE
jgi:hypothetical protein